VRFTFSLPEKVAFTSATGAVAVSPDGQRVLYTAAGADGVRRIFVRSLDSLESRALAGTDGVTGVPFWSADSRMIGFGDGTKLKKIDASGGPPQTVCDSSGLVGGGYWTTANLIIFGTAGGSASENGIYQVPAGGGMRSALTRLDQSRREIFHAHPSPLPDGKHFLYVRSATGDEGGIYAGSLDTKPEEQESTRLLADQASPVYVAASSGRTGYLLFRRDGTLLAQPFDANSLKPAGNPVPIAEQIASLGRFGVFTVSGNGLLVYRTGASVTTSLAWFDRQGKILSSAATGSLNTQVAVSPDGNRVATAIQADLANPSSVDIWLMDVARSSNTRFTFDPASDSYPVWSPDGSRIAFSSTRGGVQDLYLKASNGTGSEEILLKSATSKIASHWSRDGRFLLYADTNPKTKSDLWVLPLTGDRAPIPFLQTEFNESQGQFSPDGKWIAYVSDESGRPEIYVQPFPPSSGGGGRWMVSNGGGTQPRWRPDGKELFYLASDRTVMAAEVTPGPAFQAGVPKALFDGPVLTGIGNAPSTRWDVAAGGQRFLMVTNPQTDSASGSINLVLNWEAGLKK
jgi:Tol biopolymer transport system component